MDNKQILKFIKYVLNNYDGIGCYYKHLFNDLYLVIGSYADDANTYIKIATNESRLQCDFDIDFLYPVIDNDLYISEYDITVVNNKELNNIIKCLNDDINYLKENYL